MDQLTLLLTLVLGALVTIPVAQRFGLPAPVLMTVLGGVLALLPFVPNVEIPPDFILPLVLPPLLYAAVQRTSWRQFAANVRPVLLLAVALVFVAATWAGHASWVLRIGGLTVLTDPLWSRRILGTPARVTPVGVRWEDLPPIDAVVVSHNHYDHLDRPTLKRLPRTTPLFVPAGLARWCRRRGFTRVTELDWWEAAELPAPGGPVRFDFVPAHHWSKRTLTDTCRSLWGGWVLTDGAGRRVYFAGDTGYGHFFEEIGRRLPGIALALLPIGAYSPRWMLGPVHMDPEQAVRACADVG
ncbi:MBL fold metallo-hydrolase, partial [Streptomyces phytophilus]|uniref:MBL fold metallo-hydrolase n=1 Tax=Streptomyces phytophilus TaxID=722715 RepID=UPI001C688D5B